MTVKDVLGEIESSLPIIKKGSLLETMNSVYKDSSGKVKNISISGRKITQPLASSKAAKTLMEKDGSSLLEIYLEQEVGDILKVVEIDKNKLICENLSVKKEFRYLVSINKTDIISGNFRPIVRIGKTLNKAVLKVTSSNNH
jgi:hypothetical protein